MTNENLRLMYENLDTSFVNLAALLRYLRASGFAGRVHIELDEYDADVLLDAANEPRVREMNHATGRTAEGEEALRRLLVRATAPGGLVSVYQLAREETPRVEQFVEFPARVAAAAAAAGVREGSSTQNAPAGISPEEAERRDLERTSGELIGAVESALQAAGANFAAIFHSVRLEMADDYTFLDPLEASFEYSKGAAKLNGKLNANAYVAGISECLRRVVERGARESSAGGKSVRERVSLKLAVLARRRQSEFARFKFAAQLDRIAGTRVL